jgi:hypothetical protein
MKSEEKRKVNQFNEQLSHSIKLRLVKTQNEASHIIEDFCAALQNAAPKIIVIPDLVIAQYCASR